MSFLLASCTSSGITPVVAITLSPASTFTALPSHTPITTATPTLLSTRTVTPSLTVPATMTLAPSPTNTMLPTMTRPRATVTPRPNPSPTPASPVPVQVGSEEQQVIDLINQIRRQNNLPALTIDARLMAPAESHSQDMAQHNLFAHEGSDSSSVGERLTGQGYDWNFYAEDLACGYDSPSAVVQGWLASPAHRDNLLAANARQIGVGYVGDQGGDCHPHWTADFAAGR